MTTFADGYSIDVIVTSSPGAQLELAMLPDTITLNVGSPAADRVFTVAQRTGTQTLYYAPSANNDLAGRFVLRVSHNVGATSLVGSLVQFKAPYQTAGEYGDYVQLNQSLNRPSDADLDLVDEVLEMGQKIWAITDFRSDIGQAEL